MSSQREQILVALVAALKSTVRPSAARDVQRGAAIPVTIPSGGLVILRDGEPGEPEVTLSPLRYHYTHRAEAEVFLQADSATRDAKFDAICVKIGEAAAADRTLGGLCDWVEAQAPRPADLPVEGGAPIKAAIVPIVLHYTTTDPLT